MTNQKPKDSCGAFRRNYLLAFDVLIHLAIVTKQFDGTELGLGRSP
jgi:hypothetical protein